MSAVDETITQLAAMTSWAPSGAGYVLSARTPDGRLGRAWDQLVMLHRVEEAAARCHELADSADVYISMTATDEATFANIVNRGPGKRGGEADARWVTCVWDDVDVQGPGHAGDQLPPNLDAALELLDGLPRPTLVNATGGGLHTLTALHEPIYVPADLHAAKDLTDGWVRMIAARAHTKGWKLDAGVGDLARVLRVAGTRNHKTDPPRHVVTVDPVVDRRYPVDQLRQLIHAQELPVEVAPPPPRRTTVASSTARVTGGQLNILDAVNVAEWAEIWPTDWTFVDHETIDGLLVEQWHRPGGTQPVSAKCWPHGGCYVWSDQVPGLPVGPHSKADVLAWKLGLDLGGLSRRLIDAGRNR